jgi:galactitol PTS system EIIC component
MDFLKNILDLGPTVMMPIIFFILGLCFKVKPGRAFQAGMLVGIGFTGINLIVGMLLNSLGPATQDMVQRLGANLTVIDAGWATGAAIGWSSPLVPFVVVGAILLNVVLLAINKTQIVNIDIFNYWLILLPGSMVYYQTDSLLMGTAASLLIYLIAFIIGGLTAPAIQKMYNMRGVAFVHATCGVYVPIGIFVNYVIEKIPVLNKIDLSPENIIKKLGILGEPITLATILGAGMGALAGWPVGKSLFLAVQVAAVMILLPKMVGITVEGVMIVRDAAEDVLKKIFPGREFYIGMDTALLIGEPCIIATGLLLIPAALVIAILLPGNRMLPFVDLASIVFVISMVAPFCKRNMFRIFVTGCFIITIALYAGTDLSGNYVDAADKANVKLPSNVTSTELGNLVSSYNTPVGWAVVKASEFIGHMP